MRKRFIAIFLSILTLSMIALTGCSEKASDYTEKEHIARVTALAKKRYIDNGDYDSLEVYPLYDENDKLKYFLIELEPAGHVYVRLNEREMYGRSLYTRDDWHIEKPWFKYQTDPDSETHIMIGNDSMYYNSVRALEVDSDGYAVIYYCSPYKASDVQEKRCYLFDMNGYYIPSIKLSETYLDLIGMEEFKDLNEIDVYRTLDLYHVGFVPDSYFNL